MPNITNPADSDPEQLVDLSNHVLKLDSPLWSYSGNSLEAQNMGSQIATFLSELKARQIERANPQIAKFKSRTVKFAPENNGLNMQMLLNRELQTAIVVAAAELGIDVAVIQEEFADKSGYSGLRSEKFKTESLKPQGIPELRRRIGAIFGSQTSDAPVVEKKPDFILRTRFSIEPGSDSGLQKDVNHSVELVEPDKEVKYSYEETSKTHDA